MKIYNNTSVILLECSNASIDWYQLDNRMSSVSLGKPGLCGHYSDSQTITSAARGGAHRLAYWPRSLAYWDKRDLPRGHAGKTCWPGGLVTWRSIEWGIASGGDAVKYYYFGNGICSIRDFSFYALLRNLCLLLIILNHFLLYSLLLT